MKEIEEYPEDTHAVSPTGLSPKEIRIETYTYALPEERIAKHPLAERDQAKLLYYKDKDLATYHFSDLLELIPRDALLVLNDSKVIQARLQFRKETGARIELFCLEPAEPALYEVSLAETKTVSWYCLVGNKKKWKGDPLRLRLKGGGLLEATLVPEAPKGSASLIRFSWSGGATFGEVLREVGELPIPPYLRRATEASDLIDYQTVYAEEEGSVAAPTAGLHFTQDLLEQFDAQGGERAYLTLHVGAGTFLPVKSSTMSGHPMHTEAIEVPRKTLEKLVKALREERTLVSVGTTSSRTLESLYYIGVHLLEEVAEPYKVEQWEPYDRAYQWSTLETLEAILADLKEKSQAHLIGETRIIIMPTFQWRLVNVLITNFHQPCSTLLLLVASFVGGEEWRKIYQYALEEDYRFLSYGDGSLLYRTK